MIDKYYVRNFFLLLNSLNNTPNNTHNLSDFDDIIYNKISNSVYNLSDFYDLFDKLQDEYNNFKEFIEYEALTNKNIIGVYAKENFEMADFLNSYFNEDLFTQNKFLPTYITNGLKIHLEAINIYGNKMEIAPYDIQKICEGFPDLEDDDDNIYEAKQPFSHMIRNICVKTPNVKHQNLAFHCMNENFLANDFIIWCLDEKMITQADIDVLKDFPQEKLIIMTNIDADTEETSLKLNLNGIKHLDVIKYSKFSENDKLKEHLKIWDSTSKTLHFARNFKILFMKIKDLYEKELLKEQKAINSLKTVANALPEQFENINEIILDTEKKAKRISDIIKNLSSIQVDFFERLQSLGNSLNLNIPEPTEIDIISENGSVNALDVLKGRLNYKKYKPEFLEMLDDIEIFYEIPLLNMQGQTKYKQELLETMEFEPFDVAFFDMQGQTKYKQRLLEIF